MCAMDVELGSHGIFPTYNLNQRKGDAVSTFKRQLQTAPVKLLAKLLVLPLIACAVVGAESIHKSFQPTESQEDDSLNETFRSHYIRLEEGNKFGGTITGIDARSNIATGIGGLKVYLVKNSKVIQEELTNTKGQFEMSDVEPGTYSLCVAGQNGFLAYGVHMVEPAPDSDANDEVEIQTSWHVSSPLQVTAAVVPPEFKTLRRIMSNMLPSSVSGAVGIGSDDVRINVAKSIVAGGYKIYLTPEGTLKGRLAPIGTKKKQPIQMKSMNVFLIQDDEIYARASVKADGQFEIREVEAGVYGFAAAGKDGFAALSFEAVLSEEIANKDGEVLTSSNPLVDSSVLEVAICPSEDSDFLKDTVNDLVDDALGPGAAPPIGGPGGFLPGGLGGPGGPGGFGGPGFSPVNTNRLLRFGLWAGVAWAIAEGAGGGSGGETRRPDPTSPAN